MNWKAILYILRNGDKITRPDWREGSYWRLSKDGNERIICQDGTHAKVHVKQLEADDWGIYREPLTFENISERRIRGFEMTSEIPNYIRIHSRDLKALNLERATEIYGMRVIVDDSLWGTQTIMGYREDLIEKIKCFWCERYVTNLIEHTNEMHPGLSPRSYDFLKEKRC